MVTEKILDKVIDCSMLMKVNLKYVAFLSYWKSLAHGIVCKAIIILHIEALNIKLQPIQAISTTNTQQMHDDVQFLFFEDASPLHRHVAPSFFWSFYWDNQYAPLAHVQSFYVHLFFSCLCGFVALWTIFNMSSICKPKFMHCLHKYALRTIDVPFHICLTTKV